MWAGGSSGCCCHLVVSWRCSSLHSPLLIHWHPIQSTYYYYRKIVRGQCTLTYEKQSNIQKEAYHIYQKTQDTIVHQFSKNCIHRLKSLSTCETREMWTEYKNNTVRVWDRRPGRVGELRSSHRLVWLKHVEVKRHAGVHRIHKGFIDPMAKKASKPEGRMYKSVSARTIQSISTSTSEASWDSGNKNIAVCSLYSITSWSFSTVSDN